MEQRTSRVFSPCWFLMLLALIVWAETASAACVGDCDGNGEVTVDELIRGVNIALGNTGLNTCASFETNGDGAVTIDELLKGVNNALTGCPGATPTPTPSPTAVVGVSTPSRTPAPSATPSNPAPTLAPPTVTPTREPFAPAPDPALIASRLAESTITDMGSATKFLYDPPPGQPARRMGVLDFSGPFRVPAVAIGGISHDHSGFGVGPILNVDHILERIEQVYPRS